MKARRTEAKQFSLPIPKAERKIGAVFQRKGSPYWQARFRNATGKIVRRSTARLIEHSAKQWLTAAILEQERISKNPSTTGSAAQPGQPELFPNLNPNSQ